MDWWKLLQVVRVGLRGVASSLRDLVVVGSMVIIGATEQGLLTRLLHGSVAFDIVESLDLPVLLAERSWKERILGVQT